MRKTELLIEATIIRLRLRGFPDSPFTCWVARVAVLRGPLEASQRVCLVVWDAMSLAGVDRWNDERLQDAWCHLGNRLEAFRE